MCGRYVLAMRPSQVRQYLAEHNMPADEAPSDDDEHLRQSYNFAPGYQGLIYRAATNDRGTDASPLQEQPDDRSSPKKVKLSYPASTAAEVDGLATKETKYKLQAAKWGLIPFWTKRPPEYGSMMRTINCRDDSLLQNGGMWNTMKQRKRCIVVAEGFYEWLKKNNGKEKIPHFVKRKDGQLMCLAGLWDCVQYENSVDKLYTYTIITTDSNKQLKFLHDRMPVIFEAGSEDMLKWLDPANAGWTHELQAMLQPFNGDLECYSVDKAVGKVGNNSPNFVVPIDSKENKKNIMNFFGNQKASPQKKKSDTGAEVSKDEGETRDTAVSVEDPESNAPLPKPKGESDETLSQAINKEAVKLDDGSMIEAENEATERGIKREISDVNDDDLLEAEKSPPKKVYKSISSFEMNDEDLLEAEKSPPRKIFQADSSKPQPQTPSKTRSATSNSSVAKTPVKRDGNAKITSFFGK